MKEKTYQKITGYIKERKWLEGIVNVADVGLAVIIYFMFLILLVTLFLQHKNIELLRVVLVCGISFVLVSVFRHFYNADRPYTKYDFTPVVKKDTPGRSMPSRHIFSVFVIGMAFTWLDWKFGVFIFVIACLMAVERVIAGVHFVRDVLVGAVVGIAAGVIGFYLIP